MYIHIHAHAHKLTLIVSSKQCIIRSTSKTTVTVLHSIGVRGRAGNSRAKDFKMKFFFHAETTSYTSIKIDISSFNLPDLIMELDIPPLPFTAGTYYHGFYLVNRSAGRKARHEKPGRPEGNQNQSKAARK